MALNMGGRGLGFTIGADDKATPALNAFLGAVAKSPSQVAPLLGALGRLSGGMTSMIGSAGSATTAVGGLAASLGPLAIAIGAVVFAFMEFNEIAMRSEEIIRDGIDAYARYETSLKEVGTILHAMAGELDDLGSTAREMGVTFGTDVTQQLRGFYQTVSAGFADYKQSAEIMDTANRLAVAGVTDITSSVELLTGTIKSFGLEASDATEVSNVLFKTVEKARTTVGELAHSFAMVAPIAAISGASLEETTAALSAITVTGMPTRQSITALAGLFRSLTKITPEAQKALDKYGIELDAARIKNEGLLPILQDIQAATGGNVAALREIIREEEGFRAAAILTGEQLGHYAESLEYFRNQQDAIGVAFEDMSKNLEFQRRQFQEFHQELRTQIGEVFAPYIGKALELANKLFESLMKLPKPIQNIAFGMAGLALSMPVIAKHGLSLIWTITKLVIVGGLLTSMLIMLGPVLIGIGILMSPLIAIAGALFAAWQFNFFGIKDAVVNVWDKIMMTFKAVAAFIKGGGVISGPLAEELAKPEYKRVREWAATIWQIFKRIKVAGQAAWTSIKAAIDAVLPEIKKLFPSLGPIVDAFFSAGDASVDLEKKFPIESFKEFGETIGDAIGGAIRFAVGLVKFWKEKVKPTIDTLTKAARVFGAIFGAVFGMISVAMSPVVSIFKILTRFVEIVSRKIGEIAGKLKGGVLGQIFETIAVPLEKPGAGLSTFKEIAPGITPGAMPAAPAAGGRRAAAMPGAQAAPGPIVVNLKSQVDLDGDKMGEKTNRFLLDLQSKEMIAEPAV